MNNDDVFNFVFKIKNNIDLINYMHELTTTIINEHTNNYAFKKLKKNY